MQEGNWNEKGTAEGLGRLTRFNWILLVKLSITSYWDSKFNWALLIIGILLLALSRVIFHFIFRGTEDWWDT